MSPRKSKDKELLNHARDEGDLGTFLRVAREATGLSQGDVAKRLKLTQFQSISQWERNASGSVPINALLKLISIYGVSQEDMYEVLLKYQSKRMEEKLEKKFFGKSKKGRVG